ANPEAVLSLIDAGSGFSATDLSRPALHRDAPESAPVVGLLLCCDVALHLGGVRDRRVRPSHPITLDRQFDAIGFADQALIATETFVRRAQRRTRRHRIRVDVPRGWLRRVRSVAALGNARAPTGEAVSRSGFPSSRSLPANISKILFKRYPIV